MGNSFSSDVFGKIVLRGVDLVPPGDDIASMYFNNNAVAQTVETANTPIALRNATGDELTGWTFDAGSTGAITAFSDAGGGEVSVASTGHGLVTGDIVSIRGTTNYNGIFQVTRVDDDNFKITDTWVSNDGASDWDSPSLLKCSSGSAGKYAVIGSLGIKENGAAGSTITFYVYKNTVAHPELTMIRKFTTNDVGSLGMNGIIDVTENDCIFLVASSSGTNTITAQYGTLSLRRL